MIRTYPDVRWVVDTHDIIHRISKIRKLYATFISNGYFLKWVFSEAKRKSFTVISKFSFMSYLKFDSMNKIEEKTYVKQVFETQATHFSY